MVFLDPLAVTVAESAVLEVGNSKTELDGEPFVFVIDDRPRKCIDQTCGCCWRQRFALAFQEFGSFLLGSFTSATSFAFLRVGVALLWRLVALVKAIYFWDGFAHWKIPECHLYLCVRSIASCNVIANGFEASSPMAPDLRKTCAIGCAAVCLCLLGVILYNGADLGDPAVQLAEGAPTGRSPEE
eukprot:3357162-Amphidinium_carterae.1